MKIMNKKTRKEIDTIVGFMEKFKARVAVLENLERVKFSNLKENFQDSDKGEALEESADALEDAVIIFDDLIDQLKEAKGEEEE